MQNSEHISDQVRRDNRHALVERVLRASHSDFDKLAVDIFHYQYKYNPVYRQFCELIGRTPDYISDSSDIPFLPIALFKSNIVKSGTFEPQAIFESSGTTGQKPSRHAVGDLELYDKLAERGFQSVFGEPVERFTWYGLLPSYLERPNASLVHMVGHFIRKGQGGFYMSEMGGLIEKLSNSAGESTILIGVTFALLELAEHYPGKVAATHIIETGGMKGRRRELTRTEVHDELKAAFDRSTICSEYGMTELLSQAWSMGHGIFECAPTLRVTARDLSDPLMLLAPGERGALNFIDLGNIDSCAFIATEDAGVVFEDGRFEVHGRLDGSEQRGCNLMYPY